MTRPRVFIPQEPRRHDPVEGWKPLYDLTPALRFGTLEILLPHGPVMLTSSIVIDQLHDRLTGYTEADYILCVGDPAAIAATVLVAGKINNGAITLLRYERSAKEYHPITYRS